MENKTVWVVGEYVDYGCYPPVKVFFTEEKANVWIKEQKNPNDFDVDEIELVEE
jgi:hypothetical protein